MNNDIEIYVRPGGEHNMLNFYVPVQARERFMQALATGSIELPAGAINFEISVLPQWLTDPVQRKKAERAQEPLHVRVPLGAINVQFTEE